MREYGNGSMSGKRPPGPVLSGALVPKSAFSGDEKTKRTGSGKPGPMRLEQGLLPCQSICPLSLPVF
jgi:hypothetical protein